MQATVYKHLKVIRYFSLKTLSVETYNFLFITHVLFHDKDKFSIILFIAGCQQTFRSSDSRLSPDFWSSDNRLSLDLKVC